MPGMVCKTTHYNASAQATFRTLRTLRDNKINMLEYTCKFIQTTVLKEHKTVRATCMHTTLMSLHAWCGDVHKCCVVSCVQMWCVWTDVQCRLYMIVYVWLFMYMVYACNAIVYVYCACPCHAEFHECVYVFVIVCVCVCVVVCFVCVCMCVW